MRRSQLKEGSANEDKVYSTHVKKNESPTFHLLAVHAGERDQNTPGIFAMPVEAGIVTLRSQSWSAILELINQPKYCRRYCCLTHLICQLDSDIKGARDT